MTGVELITLVFGTLVALAIGSFTCVIIDRLPVQLEVPNEYGDSYDTRTWSEVLSGRSRCSSCGDPVALRNNVPIASWLLLRGRCRTCGAPIPVFHLIVEFLVPALFLIAVAVIGWNWRVVPMLGLVPAGVAISVIDFRTLIVPTRIVWPAFGLVLALSAISSTMADGWSWWPTALVGLISLAGPLFVLWFLLPSGMGFGDVRLAVLLGWTVGFYGGSRPIAGVVLSVFVLLAASLIGIAVGVMALGARGRKAKVPWGPSLCSAGYLAIILAQPILEPFGMWSLG